MKNFNPALMMAKPLPINPYKYYSIASNIPLHVRDFPYEYNLLFMRVWLPIEWYVTAYVGNDPFCIQPEMFEEYTVAQLFDVSQSSDPIFCQMRASFLKLFHENYRTNKISALLGNV